MSILDIIICIVIVCLLLIPVVMTIVFCKIIKDIKKGREAIGMLKATVNMLCERLQNAEEELSVHIKYH
jgi:hypothetical protein